MPDATGSTEGDEVRHDPTILSGGGASWANCSCGWGSPNFRGAAGPSLAFARHMADPATPPASSTPDGAA